VADGGGKKKGVAETKCLFAFQKLPAYPAAITAEVPEEEEERGFGEARG